MQSGRCELRCYGKSTCVLIVVSSLLFLIFLYCCCRQLKFPTWNYKLVCLLIYTIYIYTVYCIYSLYMYAYMDWSILKCIKLYIYIHIHYTASKTGLNYRGGQFIMPSTSRVPFPGRGGLVYTGCHSWGVYTWFHSREGVYTVGCSDLVLFFDFNILYAGVSWIRFTCSETICKQKKKYLRTPHRVHPRAIFKTRRATGSLRIRAGFGSSGNIFTKDQRILAKKKIWNLKFIS